MDGRACKTGNDHIVVQTECQKTTRVDNQQHSRRAKLLYTMEKHLLKCKLFSELVVCIEKR